MIAAELLLENGSIVEKKENKEKEKEKEKEKGYFLAYYCYNAEMGRKYRQV